MKSTIKKLIILSLTFVSSSSFASGAAQNMAVNMAINGVAAAVTATYTAVNLARCVSSTPTDVTACINAGLGAVQTLLLAAQLSYTASQMAEFGEGELPSADGSNGLCLNPEASGCEQDALDLQVSKTPLGEALKTGDYESFLEASREIKKDTDKTLSALEKKGFKVDQEKGTLTGPDGKVQSLAGLANDSNLKPVPSNVSEALSKKLAALGKSGSSGGSGGGVKVVDEFLDDDLNKKRGLSSLKGKKKRKTNEDFLAAMANKAGEGAIGVVGDDIFKMIQRRYNKKKKTKEFIFR